MNNTLEEIETPEVREVFLDELVGNDPECCPNCGSDDTLSFQEYRHCYQCNTQYSVLNVQRSTE